MSAIYDIHTLPEVLQHIKLSHGKALKQAVCDREYRGKQIVNGTATTLPKKLLKETTAISAIKSENNAVGVPR
jgi:transposase, IS5 family